MYSEISEKEANREMDYQRAIHRKRRQDSRAPDASEVDAKRMHTKIKKRGKNMADKVIVEMRGVKVRYLGRRSRPGKPDTEYFKGEISTEYGPEMINITGNGVEVGKTYDISVMIGTYNNSLWFRKVAILGEAKKF